MKKIFVILAFAAGLVCSCKPNTELQEYYAAEASRIYKECSDVELYKSQWDYMDAMNNIIACEMFMNLSPKIGMEIQDWQLQLYTKWSRRIEIETKYDDRPALGSADYENMVELQKCYAYQAVADVLQYSHKSFSMAQKPLCEQAIAEVLAKYPVFYE